MLRAAAIALTVLILGLCCWAVVRNAHVPTPEQVDVDRSFREQLNRYAAKVWGKHHVRLRALTGPEDAMTLHLRVEGSCAKPAIRLFILYTYGFISPVATIKCSDPGKSVSVEVRPYLEKLRATFPMIPDRPDTQLEFGGTVTQMSRHPGLYKQTQFNSRQEIIDYLLSEQNESLGNQFGTTPRLHKRGLRVYADPQDDRLLVIESVACDSLGYRIMSFSYDGVSKTTMVKWTELGGTFLVCKGERDLGFISMQAASESLGLYPVNSVAECVSRKTVRRCN